MLLRLDDLLGYTLRATDGDIGVVDDFYFDDNSWVIRYFVIETGHWLARRKVLVSPISMGRANPAERVLPVAISKEQVQRSPAFEEHQPISREHEDRFLAYYGYPSYWGGPDLWGVAPFPYMLMPIPSAFGYGPAPSEPWHARPEESPNASEDRHLRAYKAVASYQVDATDGTIGHVKDFLVDGTSWAVRYIVVDAGHWWVGHQVVIAQQSIERVSWSDARLYLNLSRHSVQEAPLYDAGQRMDRKREIALHRHYGLDGYWNAETHFTPARQMA